MRSKVGEESRLEKMNRKIPVLVSRRRIIGVMLYHHLQRLVHRDWGIRMPLFIGFYGVKITVVVRRDILCCVKNLDQTSNAWVQPEQVAHQQRVSATFFLLICYLNKVTRNLCCKMHTV